MKRSRITCHSWILVTSPSFGGWQYKCEYTRAINASTIATTHLKNIKFKFKPNKNMNKGTWDSSNNLRNKSTSSTTIVEDDSARKCLRVLRNTTLAQTTSAPSVFLNENSKKWSRSLNSSNESLSSKPVNKKSGKLENAQSYTFCFSVGPHVNQNSDDDNESEMANTIATSTMNARAFNKNSHDMIQPQR